MNFVSAPQVGFKAPEFTLQTFEGQTVSLTNYQGSPVLINFWATWCPPCRVEMPDFQQVYDEYSVQGLIILAVNASNKDSPNDVDQFIKEFNLTFPIPMDTSGNVGDMYHLQALPTTFFINRDGMIQHMIIGGPLRIPTLDKYLKPLFKGE
ncbi:MAG: TlpA disulfide reductase family protein [Anaerolineales bacterium]